MTIKCGVYKISCSNGFCYYGRSINIAQRIDCHRQSLINGKHYCKKMQNDFNAMGIKCFEFEIVKITKTYKQAAFLEKSLVNKNIKTDKSYNKHPVKCIIVRPPIGGKMVRVLLPPKLYNNLEEEARKDHRKLSPMMRLILEERYE